MSKLRRIQQIVFFGVWVWDKTPPQLTNHTTTTTVTHSTDHSRSLTQTTNHSLSTPTPTYTYLPIYHAHAHGVSVRRSALQGFRKTGWRSSFPFKPALYSQLLDRYAYRFGLTGFLLATFTKIRDLRPDVERALNLRCQN